MMRRLQITLLVVSAGICLYLIYTAQKIEEIESASATTLSNFLVDDNEKIISSDFGSLRSASGFQLIPTGKGQFLLTYDNRQKNDVRIQIYDVIGNLLLEEDSNHLRIQREYNLSESGSSLFVVKVDNQKVARIKKVTAG
ncbi:MAG: hypothetical protein AAGC88_14140 [Bacteroidota bacterium]